MRKKIICFVSAVIYAAVVIAGTALLSVNHRIDVVANYAAEAFKSLAEATEITKDDGYYILHSPNDTERFLFGESIQISFSSENTFHTVLAETAGTSKEGGMGVQK